MKLKKAAQATAFIGERTRVDTTVAIELAASWNPLMKSKARARRTRKTTTAISMGGFPALRLRVLQDHSLDDVRQVLGPVGRGLDEVDDLLPLHHVEGI